jgi:putative nucleotidyltransferase with HDIG domain
LLSARKWFTLSTVNIQELLAPPNPVPDEERVVPILAALSYGLDLSGGQPLGHAERTCVIGMRLGQEVGLDDEELADLYYALLMKDLGCSANASRTFQIMGSDDIAAKRDIKLTDWTRLRRDSIEYGLSHVSPHKPFEERVRAFVDYAANQTRTTAELVKIRSECGASIAKRIGLSEDAAEAIHGSFELWNGEGHPHGFRGEDIPRLARIVCLAQTVEVFYRAGGAGQAGMDAALQLAQARSGHWFDPQMVFALESVVRRGELWRDIERAGKLVPTLEPREQTWRATDETIETICLAFAEVIDAKSVFTFQHSTGVAGAAQAIARSLGLPESEVTLLRRAALLHDIGKLSVSNTILDKPAKLDDEEWRNVREHPRYSYEILRRIPGFGAIAGLAAKHHEKLDGTGYWRGLDGSQLSTTARILVVADVYDALAARRPYRDALPKEQVLAIMARETPRSIDAQCFYALSGTYQQAESMAADLSRLAKGVGTKALVLEPMGEPAGEPVLVAMGETRRAGNKRRRTAATD